MEKNKMKFLFSEHLELHLPMYVCLFLFMVGAIIIGILAYALIIEKQGCNDDTALKTVAVNVIINENDTIVSTLSADIKELKNMMHKMQEDTLCVTITKGNK